MTEFQTGIITLMKCAVNGGSASLPKSFSLEEAETFAEKQHITALIYDGAIRCGISPKEPAMQRMFHRYVRLMLRSERQLTEVAQLSKTFDENGIDYLLQKGCNMKKLYPKPELRYMGDADILIRVEQYDRIRNIMERQGFSEESENQYEYHWKKPALHVELHKTLIPSSNRFFYDYWASAWDKAEKGSGTGYKLSTEDEFLFLFTHFAKHYMGSGIGCRYLLDLWVFLCAYPELDTTYIEQELEKLHLLEFYQNIRMLLSVWFEGKAADERTDFISDFLFSGSSWGNWKNGQLSSAVNNGKYVSPNKVTLLLSKLFPPLSSMVYQYPVLQKNAFLLPICWFWRIMCALFKDSEKRKRGLYLITDVSDEKIAQHKTDMRYVGLHIEEEYREG